MRSLARVVASVLCVLAIGGGSAAAKPGKKAVATKRGRAEAARTVSRKTGDSHVARGRSDTKRGKRVAALARPQMPQFHGPVAGQSLGYPWSGRLQDATKLDEGEGYTIRRPGRAFGTRATVEIIEQVLADVVAEFPENHVLGIGDISAEHGGAITQHASHQAGRDVDIGLYYVEKPSSYPEDFINATEDNLDAEATYALVDRFAKARKLDGGVMMMFLDYEVQGILYHWAKDHGVDEEHLGWLFQYPKGRGADGFVRHVPNHANHIHVRFKCPAEDAGCR